MFNFSERELNEPTITDEPEAGEGNSKFYLKPKKTVAVACYIFQI